MSIVNIFKRGKAPSARTEKVALCLGGGGARGYAHIGAIKAFEEEGIDFSMVVGTSVGSIVGALYAAGVTSAEMIRTGAGLDFKMLHNGLIITPNDPSKIGRIVTSIIGDAEIEHLPKKYCAVAVDLVEGRQVLLDKGSVMTACSASACVPLFYRPVISGEMHLVDGGLLNNIPADVCRLLGADKVVSVDINPTRGGGTAELGIIDVLKATFSIMSANASINGLRATDVLIAPDMSGFKATSKEGFGEMIKLGYDAARAKIDEVKRLFVPES